MTERKPPILAPLTSKLSLSGASFTMKTAGVVKTASQLGLFGRQEERARSGTVGVYVTQQLVCPQLDEKKVEVLNGDDPKFVTKYLTSEAFERSIEGSFRFGTLNIYRATEDKIKQGDRFSDEKEGAQYHIFNSRAGYFKRFQYSGVQISESLISGGERDVVFEFQANAYCACLSKGEVSSQQIEALKKNGNSDITNYVTYDLSRLRDAISKLIDIDIGLKTNRLVGRTIVYGDKDRHWEIEDSFSDESERDPLAIFLSLAFVKDERRFAHENEYRLLMVDPMNLAGLKKDALPHIFSHVSLAECIIKSGEI